MRTIASTLRLALLAPACAGLLLFGDGPSSAQPVGGSLALGAAGISQADANTIITQTSDKALINWQSFSVAQGANVIFRQPSASAITLNRVLGASVSSIDGGLSANGQVWLINANGILFGPGSRIDVGALLATTSDIRDEDFKDGNYAFSLASPNGNAAVVNQGAIRASTVVLAAPGVANSGTIEADLGHVVLAGADTFTVDFTGDHLINFAIAAPVSQQPVDAGGKASALVANSGTVLAPGGTVLLTARAASNVIDNVINTSGMIEATSVSVQNGAIVLDAGDGTASVSGTLDASGKRAGETGGSISVLGGHTIVADGATLDASGDQGGGTVLVGGNFHGAGPQANAQTTEVGQATIAADAINNGDGGKVALWSSEATSFAGKISAQGGAAGGNGGFVETSGASLSVAPSAQVIAAAPNGTSGTWLLDPKFIEVKSSGGATYSAQPYASGTSTFTVDPASIATAITTGTDITLEANTDLTVTDAISAGTATSARTLALHAGRSIALNANVIVGSATADLIANDPNAISDRDSGAGSITEASGKTLIAGAVNLTLSNGVAAGTIGSLDTPIAIKAGSVSVKTHGANAYIKSTSDITIGTTAGGIDLGSGNLTFFASGLILESATVTAGSVQIAASGNLTLSSGGITASGSGDAIVLGAGNAFANNIGSGALSLTGGGRWLIFLQDPSEIITLGGLAGSPFYNRPFDFTTYNSTFVTGTYSAIANAGNRFVYALAPVLTVTANDTSRPYGAANPTFTDTITGFITGVPGTPDTQAAAVSGAASLTTTATANSPTPGNTATITAALGTLTSDYNYGFQFTDGTLTINMGMLTAGLTGIVSKVYDRTTDATLVAENYTLSGLAPGDVVNLNDPISGTYDTKDFGVGKTVSVTGLMISGADSSKYTLASTSISGAVGEIDKATLTMAFVGTVSKVYDASTAATLAAGNYALLGVYSGDSVTLNNPTAGTYNNKNVGDGKTVNVTGLAISGADVGNYVLSSATASGDVGTITKAPLTAGLTGTVTKVYDRTTAATLAPGNYTLSGVFAGDSVTLNDPAAGTYDNKNVDTGKTVTVTTLAISGTDSGNYSLNSTVSGAVGVITQAQLTAGLTGSVTKVYNATTAATLAPGNYTLTGVISGDSVALNNPAAGTYNNKNVGNGKTVSVSGLALSGADAANYALTSPNVSAAIGVISKATLTAALTGTVSKVYDGTTIAALAPANYTLSGVFSGDSVAVSNPASGTYDTKNIGAGKTVSVTGLGLSGGDAGNYSLSSTSLASAIGTITPKALTASLTGTVSKPYDGTAAATLAAANYALNGVVSGDSVTLNNPVSGTYDNKNAGAGKTVTATGLTLSGAGAGNYTLSSAVASGAVGVITARTATAGLTGSAAKVYDGTTAATLTPANYTLSGVLPGDVAGLNDPAGGTYDSKDIGAGKKVTVSGLGLIGADAGNYALASSVVSASIGNIAKAVLTAGLTGTVSKIYDGTVTALLTAANYLLSGFVAGDNVALNDPVNGIYDTPLAGTGKTVTVTGLALTGSNAGDYILASPIVSGPVGQINAPPVTNTILTVFLPAIIAPPVTVVAPEPEVVIAPPAPQVTVGTGGAAPAPLAALDNGGGNGGNGGETTTTSDGVTQSVGQSLDGSRRPSNLTPNTVLIGGMLNVLVPTLPTSTPHGIPSADQDFSSWGAEARWQ